MDRNKLEQSLRKKGFVMDNTKDHRYFHLEVNGKRPGISTKTSHGSKKTLGNSLQSEIKRQLRLDNNNQLRELVDCPLSHDDYIDILRKKGWVLE